MTPQCRRALAGSVRSWAPRAGLSRRPCAAAPALTCPGTSSRCGRPYAMLVSRTTSGWLRGPKYSSASWALCDRQRSSMLSTVGLPPTAYGVRWWNSRNPRASQRWPSVATNAQRPPSRSQTARLTAARAASERQEGAFMFMASEYHALFGALRIVRAATNGVGSLSNARRARAMRHALLVTRERLPAMGHGPKRVGPKKPVKNFLANEEEMWGRSIVERAAPPSGANAPENSTRATPCRAAFRFGHCDKAPSRGAAARGDAPCAADRRAPRGAAWPRRRADRGAAAPPVARSRGRSAATARGCRPGSPAP